MEALDPYIATIKQKLEMNIDFVGQEHAEKIGRNILWSSAAIGFIAGFALQSLRVTFGIFGLGLVACCVAIIPAWPAFNSHPVQWLPAKTPTAVEKKKDR